MSRCGKGMRGRCVREGGISHRLAYRGLKSSPKSLTFLETHKVMIRSFSRQMSP